MDRSSNGTPTVARRQPRLDPDTRKEQSVVWLDEEVAELSLLLPNAQAAALEAAAERRGVTVAQLVRHLVRAFLKEDRGDLLFVYYRQASER